MNDSQLCSESRAEDISLLAAGCLTAREELELREHLSVCEGCRNRFEEMSLVCDALHAARPELDSPFEPFVVGSQLSSVRTQLTIVHTEQITAHPVRTSVPNARSVRIVTMMLTACVLLFAVVQFFGAWPDGISSRPVVDVVPVRPQESKTNSASPPTLLALSRAAAESDESLDRLLASCSPSMVSETVNMRMNYEELLP